MEKVKIAIFNCYFFVFDVPKFIHINHYFLHHTNNNHKKKIHNRKNAFPHLRRIWKNRKSCTC